MDSQRDFYEKGYDNGAVDGASVVRSFSRLAPGTRIGRAARLLAGCSGTLLDVGCGSGPLLWQLRGQFLRLQGVDIAEAQLLKARAWARETGTPVDLHRCNLDTDPLPFPAASADAISCLVILELLMWPDRAVGQIAAALKPNGVLVVSVGNILAWKNRLRVLAGRIPRTTEFQGAVNGGASHIFSRDTLLALLFRHGLVPEHVTCSGRLWQVRQAWPSLLGGDILVRARKR